MIKLLFILVGIGGCSPHSGKQHAKIRNTDNGVSICWVRCVEYCGCYSDECDDGRSFRCSAVELIP